MRTEDLIVALSADVASLEPPIARRLAWMLLAGTLLAAAAYAVFLGPRPDWRPAVETVRYPLKFVPILLLAVGGVGALARIARPDGRIGGWGVVLGLAAAVLAAAVGVELSVRPADLWMSLAIGHNAVHCMTLIPVYAIAPLAAAVVALRHAAPARPRRAGLVAGLAAAGIAAALYATNCTDDSPLFVALWYPLAVTGVAVVGAALGRRFVVW